MVQLKPGDRVDCRIKAATIVSPYRDYDEIRTFEVVAVDQHGCYLYIPAYVPLKGTVIADRYQCRRLGIDKKFLDEQIIYVQDNFIYQISQIMDGLACSKCGEFYLMSAPNQENGTLICWACRNNPYR